MTRVSCKGLLLAAFLTLPVCIYAQNTTYHLHGEASTTPDLLQLKASGPDAAAMVLQSDELKDQAPGEYIVKAFDTQASVPNAPGALRSGSMLSFSFWMRKTGNGGTMFPRVNLRLDGALATLICSATASSQLTTTLNKFTVTCNLPSDIFVADGNRFYLWVGVSLTESSNSKVKAELSIEGLPGGNYDSQIDVPPLVVTPTIKNISPAAGPTGASVIISGSNFGNAQGASTVTFNGVPAAPTDWSPDHIVLPVPVGATTGGVSITVDGITSNEVAFTVGPVGTIAGTVIDSDEGTPIAGVVVNAQQSGLLRGSANSGADGSFTLNNLPVGNYSLTAQASGYKSGTQASLTVSEQTTATANFSLEPGFIEYVYDGLNRLVGVTDLDSQSAKFSYDNVGNLQSISRGGPGAVFIIDTVPNAGPVGTTVTIYGTGFSENVNQNMVQFGTVSATVTSATTTELVTRVPETATTGAITVTTPAGAATNSAPFAVMDVGPAIFSANPMIGTVGTPVTIDGTNFDNSIYNNRALFGTARATLNAASSTTISTSVPPSGSSGRISITTPSGTALAKTDFFVPPSPLTVADVEFTGRMEIGQSKPMTINAENKVGLMIFDGAAGQRVSLKLSAVNIPGSTSVLLKRPDGTNLSAANVTTSGGFIDVQTLPVSGTYTILVNPASTYTGSLTSTLYDVVDISETIVPGGPAVSMATDTPGQRAVLSFVGVAGQKVSINLGTNTIAGTTVVSLKKPDGTNMASANVALNGSAFIDTQTLPSSGTYTILVDPPGTNIGGMTIKLNDATEFSTGITPGGAPVTLTTTIPGQNSRALFNGAANQRISLSVTGVTLAGTYIYIQTPDQTTLAYVFVGASGGFIDAKILPQDGAYAILVDPSSTNTGSATLTLYNVPADFTSPITPGGTAVTITSAAPGQNASLTFNGAAGQQVSVSLSGNTIPATTSVYFKKPDATTLASTNLLQNNPGFIDTQKLPVNGPYSILIDPATTNLGSMTVKLNDTTEVTSAISPGGPAVSVSTASPGQNARLTFAGAAGQHVSLNMTGVTIPGTTTVYVKKPDGVNLASTTTTTTGKLLDVPVLPVAGEYTILVDPASTNTGGMTLSLATDVTGAITTGGPAVSVTTAAPGQNARLTFSGSVGQHVSINISGVTIPGTTTVYVRKPDGVNLASTTTTTAGNFLDVPLLPVAGAYEIVIDPTSTSVGSATVLLNDATDLTGTIVPGGSTVAMTTTVPGQNARFTFAGAAGQRVSLRLSSVTITSSAISIKKPDGANLASATANTGGGFIDAQTLPVAGTYTILVDPATTNTGSATLALYNVVDSTGMIAPGGSGVTVTTTVPGQNAWLTFSGTAGQRVSLQMSGSTIASSVVSIKKPDGANLVSTTMATGAKYLEAPDLPVAGSYSILADPQGVNTGSLTLKLNDATDLVGTIASGSPSAITITTPGQNAKLTFNGNASQRISLKIGGVTIPNSAVSIKKPDGTVQVSLNVTTAGGFIDTQTLAVAGTYTILINPDLANIGGMTLTLYDVPADFSGTTTIGGAPVAVNTNTPGQNGALAFDGTANQQVTVRVTNNTMGSVAVKLLKADGTALATVTSASGSFNLPSKILPATGTYTVSVNPGGPNTGSLTINVTSP